MKSIFKNRITGEKGFSLGEMLAALLIMLLVSVILAAGIPAAARAYNDTVDAANAQILLSTAMATLRDELGNASDVKAVEGSTTDLEYISSYGVPSKVSTTASFKKTDEAGNETTTTETGGLFVFMGETPRRLVSDQAANMNLTVTYDSISYSDGIVTVTNLRVLKGTTEVVGADTYKIRVLTGVA